MQRISIIGNTGTGKTTLASQLAEILDLSHESTDEHFWLPNWQERPHDEVIADFKPIVAGERWVTEGNYRWLRPTIWERADTVIWLDYPLLFTLGRLLKRTVRRICRNEVICNGNTESWAKTLSGDSILQWCLKTHGKVRRESPIWLAKPEYSHLNVYIFRSPNQTQHFLDKLRATVAPRTSI